MTCSERASPRKLPARAVSGGCLKTLSLVLVVAREIAALPSVARNDAG
jgi:hypothetical protein